MLIFNSLTRKKFLDLQGFENLAGLWFSSYGGQVETLPGPAGRLAGRTDEGGPDLQGAASEGGPDLQGVASEGGPDLQGVASEGSLLVGLNEGFPPTADKVETLPSPAGRLAGRTNEGGPDLQGVASEGSLLVGLNESLPPTADKWKQSNYTTLGSRQSFKIRVLVSFERNGF